MKFSFTGFLKDLKRFVVSDGKHFVFTVVFYALWLVSHFFNAADFSLKHFNKRMIGMGNFFDYDVTVRVSLFYKCGLIFIAAFFIFSCLAFYLDKWKKGIFYKTESRIINYTALAGIMFMFLQTTGTAQFNTLELVYFTHKLMLAAFLLSFFSGFKKNISLPLYVIIICLSWSLYFFVSDLCLIFGASKQPNQLIVTFLFALSFIALKSFLNPLKNLNSHVSYKLAYVLLPCMLFPVVSVLKDETYLVYAAKNKEISLFVPWIILIILIACWIVLRNYRLNKKTGLLRKISFHRLISHTYFPLLVFSLLTYNLYSYYIQASSEVFEAANKYLPLLEFKNWHVVPILEKYNSHLLSDFFFSGIYCFFNGLKGNEVELYDFGVNVVNGLLYYFLILFISRNAYLSLFVIIFYPIYLYICPDEHAFMALGIFVTYKLITKGTTLRHYILFFCCIVFLLFWKIDVGFACVLLMPVTYLYYLLVVKQIKINARNLLISFCFVSGGLLLLLGTIAMARQINLVKNAAYVLGYLDSVQTYGWTFLGREGTLLHQMHYYVFPLIILCILLLLLFRFRQLNTSSNQRLAWLSLFMLCLYYLANFQRGLVRHSLYENNDSYTSSFAYLILSLSPFVFFSQSRTSLRFFIFCGITFFCVRFFKLPEYDGTNSHYEQSAEKIKNSTLSGVKNVKERVKGATENPAKHLISFLQQNLIGNETFIDFTDHPMLYYYTGKMVPSFFYQSPICSHTDKLQEAYIEGLAKYQAPYAIYDYFDPKSGNNDELHCFYRYKIAEYLNRNYHPYLSIDHFIVWKKNGDARTDTVQFKDFLPDPSLERTPRCNINRLAYNWGTYDLALKKENILLNWDERMIKRDDQNLELELLPSIDKSSGNTLVLKIKSGSDKIEKLLLKFENDEDHTEFDVELETMKSKETQTHAIRVSCIYKWYLGNISKIVIKNTGDSSFEIEKAYLTKAL